MPEELKVIPPPVVEPEKKPDATKPNIVVEGDTARVVESPDEPALIGGKFKSQDDLLAAYKELEKKLGGKVAEEPKTPPETAKIGETPADPAKTVEAAGFNMADLSAEYADKGDLSAETRASLATKGISTEQVDAYISGQKALVAQFTTTVAAAVGGVDKMGEILRWATTGLSAAEIAAYNAVVAGGDPAATSLSLKGIEARFVAANGKDAALVEGETPKTGSAIQPFQSIHEQVAAQKDPRYKAGDKAFHREVYARIAAAKEQGLY